MNQNTVCSIFCILMLRVCIPCFIDRKNSVVLIIVYALHIKERRNLFGNKQFGRQIESASLLGRAIQRDGAENFSCKVLVECEIQKEFNEQEQTYIKDWSANIRRATASRTAEDLTVPKLMRKSNSPRAKNSLSCSD